MYLRLIAILGILISSWGMVSLDDDGVCLDGKAAIATISQSEAFPCAGLELAAPSNHTHRDPCHQGICHFGHCSHVRMMSSLALSEKLLSSSLEENTPYHFQVSGDAESRQDRPPISFS